MKDLEELAQSNKTWASTRAAMALKFLEMKESGQIDNSEYKELLEDLVRTDSLEVEADDIKMKAMLVSAISAISKLA